MLAFVVIHTKKEGRRPHALWLKLLWLGRTIVLHAWLNRYFKNELLKLKMTVPTTNRKEKKAILEGTSA